VSIAMWLLLVTGKMYSPGITLARARLTSASAEARRVAWMPVALLGAAVTIVAVALGRAFLQQPPDGMLAAFVLISETVSSGAPRVVLWPFVTVVRPLFSAWPQPY